MTRYTLRPKKTRSTDHQLINMYRRRITSRVISFADMLSGEADECGHGRSGWGFRRAGNSRVASALGFSPRVKGKARRIVYGLSHSYGEGPLRLKLLGK